MSHDPILTAFSDLVSDSTNDALVMSPRRRASVGEVDRLAACMEQALERAGLGEGDLVALAAPNGPGFLAAFLGLIRRGCVALLLDLRTPDDEKERIGQALGAAGSVQRVDRWPRSFDGCVTTAAQPPSMDLRVPSGVAVVKLTSGSTGTPRGILTPSAALVADDRALAASMELLPSERILAAVPMSHSYGLSSIVLPALMRGSLLVVPEGDGPFDTIAAAQSCDVTFLPTVPAWVGALLRMRERPPLPTSLRRLITAGAPLQREVAARFRAVYGRGVHVFYGASECGGITFDRTGSAGERGTLGTPVHGVEVGLDSRDGSGSGVVTVTSPSVAVGYFPEPGPELEGQRFATSDLGSFDNGELVLHGRTDDLVNVKGKKVNPREVERVLAGLDGVDEVVVVGVTTSAHGGDLVRAVVACRHGRLERASIEAWCRARLAAHKVPRSVVLVNEIPRTARGKVDRAALSKL